MANIMLQHPIFSLSDDIAQICKPLDLLNINYFSHVHINQDGNFTGLGSGPEFTENYFTKKYYNADIHLAKKLDLGKYIVWDNIERFGQSEQMYEEGIQFGVNHVFTIVGDKTEKGSDYYHFATKTISPAVNQKYINNIDLLELFILHFKSHVKNSPSLLKAYNMPLNINYETADYAMRDQNLIVQHMKNKHQFLDEIKEILPHNVEQSINIETNLASFPAQQLKCLNLLIKGKSSKQIAYILNLSQRTVENYLQIIRRKMNCRNQLELIYRLKTSNNQLRD
jgi:DNA-binding CsgD family transcriptional regulator